MKNLFKQCLPYLLEYKREFILAIIGMLAVAIGTAGSAQLIKPVLDEVFINKDTAMLALMPFLLIGVFSLKGMGQYIQTYYMSYIGLDVVKNLRNDLVAHLTRQDMRFFKKMHTGEILSRVTSDIGRIQDAVVAMIPSLIRESLTILALTGYVIYESPKLAFYFLIIMPIAIFPLSSLANKMKKYSRLSQESSSNMISRLGEIFSNIEVIKSNSTQELESKKFEKENYNVFLYFLKQVKVNALTSPIMEVLGSVAIGVVIYIGGTEVIAGRMTTGGFFAFAVALFMLYNPIKRISTIYNQTQDAVIANERMVELLSMKPEINSGSIKLEDAVNNVSFSKVSLNYDDKVALNNISVDMRRGESIALVGDSGAGKSSFVNLLVRFYDPASGKILINGTDSRMLTLASLHQEIAYVTQHVYIFNDTIAQNVAYGQEFDETKVYEALTAAHAMEFIENMEDGMNAMLTENGNNLSGGQRQRIALARAIYKNADILILDEATSALDNKIQSRIQGWLETHKDERITITVAHRLSTIENCDKIIVFREGEIICSGTHQNLLNECDEYKKLAKLLT